MRLSIVASDTVAFLCTTVPSSEPQLTMGCCLPKKEEEPLSTDSPKSEPTTPLKLKTEPALTLHWDDLMRCSDSWRPKIDDCHSKCAQCGYSWDDGDKVVHTGKSFVCISCYRDFTVQMKTAPALKLSWSDLVQLQCSASMECEHSSCFYCLTPWKEGNEGVRDDTYFVCRRCFLQ